jgi:outer membrane protein assembly factor BamB
MLRKALALQIVLVGLSATALFAQSNSLVPQNVAARHGLHRAWFTVISLDRAVGHIAHMTLHGGTLFVQTNHAMLHAIDAETGRTIWMQQIGARNRPSLEPAANDDFVAVLNGTMLHVVDRKTGKPKWERRVIGSPDGGPALSATHVFAPMSDGTIQGFPIADVKAMAWVYKSAGHIRIQPLITPTTVSWPTDRGHYYVATTEQVAIKCRIETHAPVQSQAAFWTPYLYACSLDGYVYALHEKTGKTDWKFPTGDPISKPPVAVEGRVYVVSDAHTMFCLDGATGQEAWVASGVTDFLSASPTRIYVADQVGRLLVLDAKTGARLDAMPIGAVPIKPINSKTDRIYLADRTGLVQCLHEIELTKPVMHIPPAPEKPADKAVETKPAPKKPAAAAAEGEDEAAMEEGAPAAEEGEAMEATPEEESPFE